VTDWDNIRVFAWLWVDLTGVQKVRRDEGEKNENDQDITIDDNLGNSSDNGSGLWAVCH
jgi:hypothetical protein